VIWAAAVVSVSREVRRVILAGAAMSSQASLAPSRPPLFGEGHQKACVGIVKNLIDAGRVSVRGLYSVDTGSDGAIVRVEIGE